jgi:hypothetical protein
MKLFASKMFAQNRLAARPASLLEADSIIAPNTCTVFEVAFAFMSIPAEPPVVTHYVRDPKR